MKKGLNVEIELDGEKMEVKNKLIKKSIVDSYITNNRLIERICDIK